MIIIVGKLSNWCTKVKRGFAKGIIKVVSFMVLLKILQAIWEAFSYESNRGYNSYKFVFLSENSKTRINFSAS